MINHWSGSVLSSFTYCLSLFLFFFGQNISAPNKSSVLRQEMHQQKQTTRLGCQPWYRATHTPSSVAFRSQTSVVEQTPCCFSLILIHNLLWPFISVKGGNPAIQLPPSTTRVLAVISAEAPLARKTVASAISLRVPSLWRGNFFAKLGLRFFPVETWNTCVNWIGEGQITTQDYQAEMSNINPLSESMRESTQA